MRFADEQPASKGNLAVHCGGPGTLSNCLMASDWVLGEDNLKNYNVITIDQVRYFTAEDNEIYFFPPLNTFSYLTLLTFNRGVWDDLGLVSSMRSVPMEGIVMEC